MCEHWEDVDPNINKEEPIPDDSEFVEPDDTFDEELPGE